MSDDIKLVETVKGEEMYEAKLLMELVDPTATMKMPTRTHATDSGVDLYANSIKRMYVHGGGNGEAVLSGDALKKRIRGSDITLSYLERVLIGTGIKATVGKGYELQVRPRSGLALKQGLTVLNTPGTIDEGYRDEICIILINLSRADQTITRGDRIAQLVVAPVCIAEMELVNKLPPPGSDRKGGFGSSGK